MRKNKLNKLGLVVATKEYAYWNEIVDSLKIQVNATEKKLKWEKFCLVNATAKLLKCPKPIK